MTTAIFKKITYHHTDACRQQEGEIKLLQSINKWTNEEAQ